jgi:hypothetical protein
MFTDVSQERTVYICKVKEYSILKMDAVRFSETLVNVYQTTWCHIRGDRALDSRLRENLKSHILILSEKEIQKTEGRERKEQDKK